MICWFWGKRKRKPKEQGLDTGKTIPNLPPMTRTRALKLLPSCNNRKSLSASEKRTKMFFLSLLLCWVTQEFELYAAFDPLADKAQAIKICNRVCQWVKDVENEIFLLGASPFSW